MSGAGETRSTLLKVEDTQRERDRERKRQTDTDRETRIQTQACWIYLCVFLICTGTASCRGQGGAERLFVRRVEFSKCIVRAFLSFFLFVALSLSLCLWLSLCSFVKQLETSQQKLDEALADLEKASQVNERLRADLTDLQKKLEEKTAAMAALAKQHEVRLPRQTQPYLSS